MLARIVLGFEDFAAAREYFRTAREIVVAQHAGYYGKPECGGYVIAADGRRHSLGASTWDHREGLAERGFRWTTSGGNIIEVALISQSERVEVLIAGRRHGIPWWALPAEAQGLNDVALGHVVSAKPGTAPWKTTTGSPEHAAPAWLRDRKWLEDGAHAL